MENYRDCVSDFQELCTDLQTFNIDLRRDEEFQKSSELLRTIASDKNDGWIPIHVGPRPYAMLLNPVGVYKRQKADALAPALFSNSQILNYIF